MFLSGALFVLFLAGCWLLCLTDVATTPTAEFPGLSKRGWITLIALTLIPGVIAWYLTGPRRRTRCWPRNLASHATLAQYDGADWYQGRPLTPAEAALARHPASQARRATEPAQIMPVGPDDDPEFLRQLAERIRREQ